MMYNEIASALLSFWKKKDYRQILVFSSLFELGFTQKDYENLIHTFKSLTRDGLRFLFPSFTYSSRRNQVFDALESAPDPQVGAISRVLFEQKEFTRRTLDPDFSYLILDRKFDLLKSDGMQFGKSFGIQSHHENLFKSESLILLLGPVLDVGLTPVMHLENLFGVPWRNEIPTQYVCAQSERVRGYSYYALNEEYPQELLPLRNKLKPIIENLTLTQVHLSGLPPFCIFDWAEFQSTFFDTLEKNIFFQSISPPKESI
jgi:aminoglycoside N3'-acetyltransferase